MKEMVVRGQTVYVETDKDGYVSFSTDGMHPTHHKEAIDAILAALRSAQTEEDREYEGWQRSLRRRA